MTTIRQPAAPRRTSFSDVLEASPALTKTGLLFLALFVVCALLSQADPRLINGISVWIKPAKFYLSLSLHSFTIAAALLLLPEGVRASRGIRASATIMVAMMAYEMIYITFRAARGEASHFNDQTLVPQMLYALMGFGAVVIMLATAYVGYRILRDGPPTLLARATGWSFIAAALLTIWTAGTLSQMGSHWIGGDMSDATGLPLLGWSRTGGDLRSAHFFGLHIMQAVPGVAFLGSRALVWATATGFTVATVACYILALSGQPLIPLH